MAKITKTEYHLSFKKNSVDIIRQGSDSWIIYINGEKYKELKTDLNIPEVYERVLKEIKKDINK